MANMYVDFSATYDGDGTAYNQAAGDGQTGAYKTLVGKSFNSNDKVWIRRSGSLTITTSLALSSNGVVYIGWPKEGDQYYDTRPSGDVRTTWDADSNNYAAIVTTTDNVILTLAGTASEYYRLSYTTNQANGSNSSGTVIFSGTSCIVDTCTFVFSYKSASAYALVNITGSYNYLNSVIIDASTILINSHLMLVSGLLTSIKNITIKNKFNSSSYASMYIGSHCISVDGLALDFTGTTSNGYGLYIAASRYTNIIQNITITNPTTYSCVFYVNGTGNQVFLSNGNNTNIFLTISSSSINNFISLKNAKITSTVAFNSIVSTILYLDTITFTNSGTDITTDSTSYNNTIYEYNVTHTESPYNFSNSTCFITSLNTDGQAGYWQYVNSYGILQASDVYRTGGTNFSIWGQIVRSSPPLGVLNLGKPGNETIFIELESGVNTVTLYGAHKNFSTAPDKGDIYFEITYFDNGTTTTLTSKLKGTALVSDDSTWNNDTGLTIFKTAITTPSLTGAATAAVRLYASPVKLAGAYFYLDPSPVVS